MNADKFHGVPCRYRQGVEAKSTLADAGRRTELPAATRHMNLIEAAIVAQMLRISHILRINHVMLGHLCERCGWCGGMGGQGGEIAVQRGGCAAGWG